MPLGSPQAQRLGFVLVASAILLCPAHARARGPLKLRLDGVKLKTADPTIVGMGLQLAVVNVSKRPQTAFRDDGRWHSAELIIRDARGRKLKASDSRSVRSTSATAAAYQRGAIEEIAPGGELLLGSGAFRRRRGSGCELRWGPFLFRGVESGTYEVRARWRRSTKRYYDAKAKRWGTAKNAWTGELKSNATKVYLHGC